MRASASAANLSVRHRACQSSAPSDGLSRNSLSRKVKTNALEVVLSSASNQIKWFKTRLINAL
jgi:hypothetical protein